MKKLVFIFALLATSFTSAYSSAQISEAEHHIDVGKVSHLQSATANCSEGRLIMSKSFSKDSIAGNPLMIVISVSNSTSSGDDFRFIWSSLFATTGAGKKEFNYFLIQEKKIGKLYTTGLIIPIEYSSDDRVNELVVPNYLVNKSKFHK